MSRITGFEYQINDDNDHFDPAGIKALLKTLYVDERFLNRIDGSKLSIMVKFEEPIIMDSTLEQDL
jgi:hypothetical protein